MKPIELIGFVIILIFYCIGWNDAANSEQEPFMKDKFAERQLFLGSGKETSTVNFVRLVVMRLIYGIASSFGEEDRLDDVLNGAFVPPNADEGFGGIDDSEGGLLGNVFSDDLI